MMFRMQDHERAQRAFEHVSGLPQDQRAKYRSMVMKLPATIQMAGLAPAMHFVAARGEAGQRLILDHLAEQLGLSSAQDLLADLRCADFAKARARTREIQRTLAWYKRFCQSLIREDQGAFT